MATYIYTKLLPHVSKRLSGAEDQWTTITNLNKAKDIITSNFTNWADKFDAKKIIVCLTGSHNFRKQLSDTYKSNRKSKRKPEGFCVVYWLGNEHLQLLQASSS